MKIKEPFDKDNIFFTADTHFDHTNIIEYCGRPFKDVGEMNETLIANWNSVIPKGAIVFHGGDFAFADHKFIRDISYKLNGHIHLLQGNHDRTKEIKKAGIFVTIHDLLEITIADEEVVDKYQKIVLCHYPLASWHGSHKGYWHLFGHVHGEYKSPHPIAIEIGVDVNDFSPLSYQQVKTSITKRALTAQRT